MSRAAAVVLLLAVVAGLLVGAGRPLWAHFLSQAELLEERQLRLEKMRRLAARKPAFEREVMALRAARAESPDLLPQSRPAVAVAALQARLKRALDATGGRLLSAKPVAVKEAGAFRLVALDTAVQVSNDGLQRLLRSLEGEAPRLVVQWLTVDGPGARVRRGRALRAAPLLRARFQLRGVVAAAQ